MSTGLHPFSLIQGLNPCSCVLSLICLSPLSVESFLSSSMHAALPPNFKILSHSPRSPYRYYLISQLLSIAIPPKGCWMIASFCLPPLSLPPIPVSLCPHHCTGYSSQGHWPSSCPIQWPVFCPHLTWPLWQLITPSSGKRSLYLDFRTPCASTFPSASLMTLSTPPVSPSPPDS